MDQSLRTHHSSSDDPLSRLQGEVAKLEAELERVKQELGAFELEIQKRLHKELVRVQELSELYKRLKKEKKEKRLEQKRRGKNYKEPTQLPQRPKAQQEQQEVSATDLEESRELRRLYKEAVVHVHPDKFIHAGEEDKIQLANAITAQLNGIYKRGDLEELIQFYHAILSGHEAADQRDAPSSVQVDESLRMASLKRKKEAVTQQLEKLKSAYTYTVLTTYENPQLFIDELYLHFQERIKQLEKRTRKAKE